MHSLETELARARELDEAELADAVETIGFECTRCGACCKAEADDPHTATVFPDEVRELQGGGDTRESGDVPGDGGVERSSEADYDWRDVARPMPYGLTDGPDGPEGETFEWALQTDACGDCTFYEEGDDGMGACTVHEDRPLVCRTYPFSVALGGTARPMGDAVDEAGMVRAHECEGLGRDITRADAEELAAALKERSVRELEEAIAVRDGYEPATPDPGEVVVHDSEGAKRPDGRPLDAPAGGAPADVPAEGDRSDAPGTTDDRGGAASGGGGADADPGGDGSDRR
ncbi:YkgJ family cysteine cluster protein [Halorarum salinum]|uniref:YkgJ family cysteine cluster protein n=1 Tax=Halorarum salinum TaxID=2743089 RepID=A0A7D5QF78_9EURY|nr:YkgJ family cysteine cluster protein [Halobaculum salinum]